MQMRMYSVVLLASVIGAASPAAAQEVALKGGVAWSNFDADGPTPFDQRLVATSLGGHMRFRFGPVWLQPELHVVTRGAEIADSLQTQLRVEYLEVPLLLTVPFRFGAYEVYAFGGPMVALETRCRSITEANDLKTNVACDPPRPPLFERRALDYGLAAGGGASRELGSGRLLIEARRTWGMNNIYEGGGATELRNQTLVLLIGYVIAWDAEEGT
ncbi:MAG: porin family protein [Gemmatimonadota bacterium]